MHFFRIARFVVNFQSTKKHGATSSYKKPGSKRKSYTVRLPDSGMHNSWLDELCPISPIFSHISKFFSEIRQKILASWVMRTPMYHLCSAPVIPGYLIIFYTITMKTEIIEQWTIRKSNTITILVKVEFERQKKTPNQIWHFAPKNKKTKLGII